MRLIKSVLIVLAVVLAAFPVTFVVTFMLDPLWSWIEATYGIESIGHSGPADWCFWLVFCILVLTSLTLLLRAWRRPPEKNGPPVERTK